MNIKPDRRCETGPSYLVNEVTDSILARFPSMRIVEVPVAFVNGIRGKYGEYFGLCVVPYRIKNVC